MSECLAGVKGNADKIIPARTEGRGKEKVWKRGHPTIWDLRIFIRGVMLLARGGKIWWPICQI